MVSAVGSSSIIAFLNGNDGTKVRDPSSFPPTEVTGQPGRSSSLERAEGDAGSSTTQPINATQEQGPPNQVESAGMQARPSSQRLSLDSVQSVGSIKQRASERDEDEDEDEDNKEDSDLTEGKRDKRDLTVVAHGISYGTVLHGPVFNKTSFSSSRLDTLELDALVRI